MISPMIIFSFVQLPLHREFPPRGGFPSPADLANRVEKALIDGREWARVIYNIKIPVKCEKLISNSINLN